MGAGRDLHGRRKDGSEVPVEVGLNPIETPKVWPCWRRSSISPPAGESRRKTAQQRNELAHLSRVAMLESCRARSLTN